MQPGLPPAQGIWSCVVTLHCLSLSHLQGGQGSGVGQAGGGRVRCALLVGISWVGVREQPGVPVPLRPPYLLACWAHAGLREQQRLGWACASVSSDPPGSLHIPLPWRLRPEPAASAPKWGADVPPL